MSAMAERKRLKTQIRWLIRRDMPETLEIEKLCFEFPWSEEDFLVCLRQRNCIGMVAEYEGFIVGFMVYELHKSRLRLLNLAVSPWAQRKGVGQQLIKRLQDKLAQQRRRQIIATVRETNLDAQLFFRSQGFKCVAVLRGSYDDTDEDGYEMLYNLPRESECMGR